MKTNIILWIILFLAINVYSQNEKHLVVLHVNDTHSRIEPMPDNDSRNPNEGGMARNEAYIQSVKKENPNTLAFHAGDFVQGTPYFNMFKGEAEVALMNLTGFDAACIGNHEFDYGLTVMAKMFKQAKFPIIATNYDFSNTPLKDLTKEYLIIKRGGLKIGVIGIGIDPEGLVARNNYEGMIFLHPAEMANRMALFLKEKKKCDLVICLSHLGYNPDVQLAKETKNIDMIIGAHSHTFMSKPFRTKNADGKEIVINQMGKNGIYVGRLDITLGEKGNDK
ncbi:metallophosphatase [Bacteroidia bacterium]|nr:metallophosphatase [Bacteroidia bacterium]GHV22278.1 metallophosphatase [Bacteroidia bacterium]